MNPFGTTDNYPPGMTDVPDCDEYRCIRCGRTFPESEIDHEASGELEAFEFVCLGCGEEANG